MRLQRALQDPAAVKESIEWLQQHAPQFPIGGELEAIAARGDDEAHAVQSLLDNLEKADYRELACQIKRTYGLGEIVFASPEFSHAGAGGLAQVLTGLPLELSKAGIPVTIITPLYRHYNGQRHPAADEILTNGLLVGNERVIPSYATTISVAVGPTRWSGSSWNKRPPATIRCKVFHAQSGQIRVLLLSSPGVFDRLYQPVSSDEQLRRAIIFSRAALETIASEQLAIRPRVVISNDWMTACIPAFLSLDPHYQRTPWLACCKSVHMIHNGGADYHGRLPLNVNREDLWPMFNLAPEHYFGFKDPHRDDLINLSMAAVRHAQGGVITVSQPYAEQLVSHHSGGDGLEHVLRHRSSDVAGISNGIKREELETFLATRTGLNFDELCCTTTLLQAKTSLRRDLQNRYGLVPSDSAFLISFVARLAEQKGLELLSGYVGDGARSALEDILIRHPNVQIIIAGPTTPGDRSASNLRECVHHLAACYPGRVAALCDYIAHSTALEIISASSLFLMPSRFEPGGISQLEALAVGTPVIGRNVGGIKATIDSFNPGDGRGTGFLFNEYSADAFVNTAHWAIETCSHASVFSSIVSQARLAQHSWSDRAPTFAATLQKIVLGEQRFYSLPFLSSARTLFDRARVPSSHDT
jgi:starch synthase